MVPVSLKIRSSATECFCGIPIFALFKTSLVFRYEVNFEVDFLYVIASMIIVVLSLDKWGLRPSVDMKKAHFFPFCLLSGRGKKIWLR